MVSTRLRVKELLKERRWTTKVLAEKTGMSESYLTHIKNGTRRWNEDALKKLALAFGFLPTDLFEQRGMKPHSSDIPTISPELLASAQNSTPKDLKLKIVPIVGQIPSQPSEHNNQALQVATGFKNQFVPVFGIEDSSMFCLHLDDNSLTPVFEKGDLLVVSPEAWTNSGDIVAVEYGAENPTKAPMALVRGKDQFRIIGKVILRYQKM